MNILVKKVSTNIDNIIISHSCYNFIISLQIAHYEKWKGKVAKNAKNLKNTN